MKGDSYQCLLSVFPPDKLLPTIEKCPYDAHASLCAEKRRCVLLWHVGHLKADLPLNVHGASGASHASGLERKPSSLSWSWLGSLVGAGGSSTVAIITEKSQQPLPQSPAHCLGGQAVPLSPSNLEPKLTPSPPLLRTEAVIIKVEHLIYPRPFPGLR